MSWRETSSQARLLFARHPFTIIGLAYLSLVAAAAVLAPWITHQSYEVQNIAEQLQGSSAAHPMGTDSLGRDLFSRLIFGSRVSLLVGIATALFSLVLGTITGAAAGYYGGRVDGILMRVVDLFYVFP